MYCVKCGVKLQDSADRCPLCGTPVYYPEKTEKEEKPGYSDLYPKEERTDLRWILGAVTLIMTAVALVCFIVCIRTYGWVFWSPYVMLGLALAYIILVLPFWFPKQEPLIFIPIDFVAIGGYLLFICLYNGDSWFLSFAFPVTLLAMGYTIAGIIIHRFFRRRRMFLTGFFFIAIGCGFMLVEMFQNITFGTGMFLWSLYCVIGFSLIGIFLIIAGVVPSLHEAVKRKLFF